MKARYEKAACLRTKSIQSNLILLTITHLPFATLSWQILSLKAWNIKDLTTFLLLAVVLLLDNN